MLDHQIKEAVDAQTRAMEAQFAMKLSSLEQQHATKVTFNNQSPTFRTGLTVFDCSD